jgi:hypothetical protein
MRNHGEEELPTQKALAHFAGSTIPNSAKDAGSFPANKKKTSCTEVLE